MASTLTVLAAGSFVLKLALDKPVESVPAMSVDLPAVTTAAPVQTSATAETTLPVTSSETEIAVPVFVTPHRTEASKELDDRGYDTHKMNNNENI